MSGRGVARAALSCLAVGTPFVLGAAAADRPGPGVVEFVMSDPAIVESSGLAFAGPLATTVNDSGDSGRVFVVDPTTGETVGVTTWSESPDDVEAIAPSGPSHVWVADIGDNLRARRSVEVVRVPVGRGDRTVSVPADVPSYELTYPDGPRDAEALLAHPVTGRLLVVSKGVFGGEVFAAPPDLDPSARNVLTPLGPVVGIVTDGAFWPDGRHLVLRTYDRAHVYSYPALEHVAELDLPQQPQGEGVAVSADGRLHVSSEGQFSEVLRVPLPDDVRRLVTEPAGPDESGEQRRVEPVGWWQHVLSRLLPPV